MIENSVCSLLETDREVFVVPGGAESGMGHGAHGSGTDEEVVQAMMHEPHLIVRYSTYCTVNFFEKLQFTVSLYSNCWTHVSCYSICCIPALASIESVCIKR